MRLSKQDKYKINKPSSCLILSSSSISLTSSSEAIFFSDLFLPPLALPLFLIYLNTVIGDINLFVFMKRLLAFCISYFARRSSGRKRGIIRAHCK
jgi:hypothetical protein